VYPSAAARERVVAWVGVSGGTWLIKRSWSEDGGFKAQGEKKKEEGGGQRGNEKDRLKKTLRRPQLLQRSVGGNKH